MSRDVGAAPGDGGHEGGDEQLGVRVRVRLAVAYPVDAGEVGSAAAVHAAAEVDLPRRRDERGHQVRGGDVDRQDRTVHDAGVVDDSVKAAQRVRLLDEGANLILVREVADDRLGTVVDEVPDGGQPRRGAGVHDDPVAVVEERLGGRPADAVGGPGDQDACHDSIPFLFG